MKVYVLEHGEYSGRFISGVFSSLELAQAAHEEPENYPSWGNRAPTNTWVRHGDCCWSFDGAYGCDITEYELDEA